MRDPPTPDLDLTIPGPLRYWVAEAVYTEVARVVEEERLQPKRRRIKSPRSIADALRDIAARIQP